MKKYAFFLFALVAGLFGLELMSFAQEVATQVAQPSALDKIIAAIMAVAKVVSGASDKIPTGGVAATAGAFIAELLFLRLPKTTKPLSIAHGVVAAMRGIAVSIRAVLSAVMALIDAFIALVGKAADFLDKVLPQNVAAAAPAQSEAPKA